jgi:hypothetical protein
MKYKKYIISFIPGSSGRFVLAIMDRMILGLGDTINISEENNAHENNIQIWGNNKFGLPNPSNNYEPLNVNTSGIYVFHTHIYPNFDLINSRFENVGVILIKPEIEDMREILFNNLIKNKNIESMNIFLKKYFYPNKTITNSMLDIEFNFKKHNKIFFTSDTYPDNCLVIKYSEIYETIGDNYQLIEKLKKFTGISIVPTSVIDACKQYNFNRTEIINQHGLR